VATIDERVVSLKMNNKQFLSAIKESASGMDRLKESLKMEGAANGLKRMGEIAKNTTLGDLARSAVDAASNMSVMQGIGITALGGIGAAALSAGKSMLQSFIQPAIDGFKEYETQINAVQTILANTSQNGTTLDQVNAALDELNSYADKTIYNFTEMTSAIGTFTVAGVGLEDATASVKGFSNMAALSGANATQAAQATYQLAQAMSSGVVKLQDWMSLEHAGIAGKQFQDALIETSRIMNTGVDAAIEKQGNFRLSLQEGWLTSEVMMQTLKVMTNDLSEAQIMEMGYSEEQAHKMKQLAQAAGDSATQIRTFSQMIGTWGEALGSGWAETWRILIGDFNQAQTLFTSVGNWVSGVIGDMSRARNDFLKGFVDLGGRDEILRSMLNIFQAMIKVLGQIGTAFRRVFLNASPEGLYKIIKAFADFTEKLIITNNFADKLEWTFTGLFSVFHIFATIIGEVAQVIFTVASHIISALFPAFTGVNSGVFQITKVLGKAIYWFDQWFTKLDLGGKILKLLLPPIDLVGKAIKWVSDKIHDFIMWIDFTGKVKGAGEGLKNLASKFGLVKDALKNSVIGREFSAAMDSIHSGVDKAKSKINEFAGSVGDKLKAKLISGKAALSDYFKGFNLGDMSSAEAIVASLGTKFDELGQKLKISEKVQWLKEKLVELKEVLIETWNTIQNSSVWDHLGKSFSDIGGKVKEVAVSFRDWVNGHGEVKAKAKEAAGAVSEVGTAAAQAAKETGQAAKENFLKKWFEDIKQVAQAVHLPELFDTIKQKFVEFKDFVVNTFAPKVKEGAKNAFGSIGTAMSQANSNLKSYDMGKILVGAIGGGVLIAFTRWINSFKENFDKIGNVADKLGNVFDKLGGVLEAFEQKVKAKALLTIAIALGVLAGALILMSLVPAPKLLVTLAVLKFLFKMMDDMLESMTKMVAFKNDSVRIVAMLIAMGAAMILMATAVRILAGMDLKGAVVGLAAMKILMMTMQEFMTKMAATKGVEKGAGILLALAASCVILSLAVYTLGSMDTGKAIQGVVTLAAVVAILSGFMMVVSKDPFMGKGAAILLSLAVSCNILVAAIWMLGTMDTGKLLQGVIALGVIIAELSVAMAIAGRANARGAAAIIAMSAAVIVLTGAVAILGNMDIMTLAKGLIALAAGLAILAISMAAADAFKEGGIALGIASIAFLALASAMKTLSGITWTQLAIGLIALAGGMLILVAAAAGAQYFAVGMIILTAALLALGLALLPISIGMAAFAAVLGICATTGAAAFLVLTEGLKQLAAILPQVAIDFANAIANFIITLGAKAPELAVAMAALLGAIIYAINANIPGIVASLFILIQAMLTELANHAYEFGEKGATILANFLNGIADNIGKVIDAATNVILNFLDGIARNGPKIIDKGMWTVLKLLEGVRDAINKYAPRFNKVGREIAWAIVDGMTNGLASKAWSFGESMVSVAKKGYNKVKNFFGIHSPSRLMKELGGFVGEGLAIGIENTGERVAGAGDNMASAAYDAMSRALDGVNDLIEDDPSFKPEIKPILDLTEMQKQAKGINNFLPAIGVTAQAANAARPPAPIAVDNSDKNSQNGVTNITFNQTNNSPEALDAATIYRNTNTQLAMAKDKLTL
jgi:putative tape measure domain protein